MNMTVNPVPNIAATQKRRCPSVCAMWSSSFGSEPRTTNTAKDASRRELVDGKVPLGRASSINLLSAKRSVMLGFAC
jgi:hypothetical protein